MKLDQVYTYGAAVLREKAAPIAKVDERVRQIAKTLLVRMYESDGVGLAAEQVGIVEAICVVDVSRRPNEGAEENPPAGLNEPPASMPLTLINPAIVEMAGKERGREGCLSFPEICVEIARAAEVVVSFMDLEGQSRTLRVKGLLARVIQHEVDHLNGILLVDRMSPAQKVALAGQLRRLKKQSVG
ncbi:MAG: peptide deformylase [Verrucomicrobiota bacterium]|nr:peptide deformylase [Verrucomicrobiota bacterium]